MQYRGRCISCLIQLQSPLSWKIYTFHFLPSLVCNMAWKTPRKRQWTFAGLEKSCKRYDLQARPTHSLL